MAEELTLEGLKLKLKDLISKSEAIKTLPEKERAERINLMMLANDDQTKQLIKIFEDEQFRLKQINENFPAHEAEINKYLEEEKEKLKTNSRKDLKIKEKVESQNEEEYAENLLKKLDEIV